MGQGIERLHKAAVVPQNHGHHGNDPKDHNNPLDKIIDGCGHISPSYYINPCQHRHDDNTDGIVNIEGHAEKTGEPIIKRGSIGD